MKAMLDPRIVATSTHRPTFGAQGVYLGAERITPSSHGAFTKFAISSSLSSPEAAGQHANFTFACPLLYLI